MMFNSLEFLIFFPIVVTLYFVIPHKFRYLLLLAASIIFYVAFIPKYLIYMGFIILIDYFAAQYLQNTIGTKRKWVLGLSIFSNIGILAFFKYAGFTAESINSLANVLHWNYSLPVLALIVPLGLSFHTFQALSYTIEVFRGNHPAEKNFLVYALYVLFYPQLVAGPIERPQHLLPQFREIHRFETVRVVAGLQQMLWGFFKKLVIADQIAPFVNMIYNDPQQYTGLPLILATLLFGIQIYCDFSGYSDIAIGSAKVMGFTLMNNFNRPYVARSLSDFWQRWHISLSTWFKDYIYIPLGGNRVSPIKHYRNLLVVFALSGLWHGANWTFVIWGALHGLFLVISSATKSIRTNMTILTGLHKFPRLRGMLSVTFTFSLVSFLWIFFRANNIEDAFYIIKHLTVDLNSQIIQLYQMFDLKDVGKNLDETSEVLRMFSKVFSIVALGNDFIIKNLSGRTELDIQGNFNSVKFFQLLFLITGLFLVEWFKQAPRDTSKFKAIRLPAYVSWAFSYAIIALILIFGLTNQQEFIYFQF